MHSTPCVLKLVELNTSAPRVFGSKSFRFREILSVKKSTSYDGRASNLSPSFHLNYSTLKKRGFLKSLKRSIGKVEHGMPIECQSNPTVTYTIRSRLIIMSTNLSYITLPLSSKVYSHRECAGDQEWGEATPGTILRGAKNLLKQKLNPTRRFRKRVNNPGEGATHKLPQISRNF